ncbi:hypothetical protein NUU61_002621 [Penicillium alfredii]|uniref:RING and UBP finger domain protein n=1 Tax=Penicillium alfredii TaxID=1506179 RepID=A0A9W9FS39_9EURO|nr:uncharacterized protein NUU61_002621 [Penicillium alfredii]KAJ5105274.1 hypothetical protein NUU61_002621 [Penicillium alfredii]
MPAYFYHLSLELLLRPSDHTSAANSLSLALDSAREALLPFQTPIQFRSSRAPPGTGREPHTPTQSYIPSGAATHLSQQQQQRTRHSSHTTVPHTNYPTPAPSDTDSSSSSPSTRPSTSSGTIETDHRFDAISIECIDMVAPDAGPPKRNPRCGNAPAAVEVDNLVAAGIGTDILGGLRTKGRYIPLDQKVADSIWGIVHLYRDAEESPYLAGNDDDYPTYLKGSAAAARHPGEQQQQITAPAGGASSGLSHVGNNNTSGRAAYPFPATVASSAHSENADCTTLCILAVPSYLSPSDFLGFMGERTMDDVSHFRMIRTARANRYMVLMKFRSARKAQDWQKEWNGKVFNSMEPETCHVVFVKTVEIQVVDPGSPSALSPAELGTLPPSQNQPPGPRPSVSGTGQATLSMKPLAPPTPALIELPTCPVCLERMDETTGLLTIICQHVFHCTCLQKWKGSGCPVCRYTQDDFRKSSAGIQPEDEPAECSVCHSEANLWACLICGKVGCGRYDGAHAFEHWKETTHAFAMDLNSQRVWDYVGDAYVHRIIQSKTDGKLVELPAADHSALDPPDWADAVPREKLENMSVEYTHLLTNQLESQRAYFEEIVERAADKASQASAAATAAEDAASAASSQLTDLQSQYDTLTTDTVPALERQRDRAQKRADKFESLARQMERNWNEEKTMNQSMLDRIKTLTVEADKLNAAHADLVEQNRDLTFFISGSQRLQGQGDDVVQGTLSVPQPPAGGKKKNNNKKKKKKPAESENQD